MTKSYCQGTRERILDAAVAVFCDVDFHQVTIRQIASRAGVALATVYEHFESKEHLLHSTAAVKLEEMTEGLEEHLLGISGVLGKARKMTWYLLRYHETNPELTWLLDFAVSPKSLSGSKIVEIGQRQAEILRSILREGQTCGDVATDIDIRLAALMYFGALHQLVMRWLIFGRSYSLTNDADGLTDMFFNAVKQPEGANALFRCPLLEPQEDLSASFEKEAQVDTSTAGDG